MKNRFIFENGGEFWPGVILKRVYFRQPPGKRKQGQFEAEARSAVGRAVIVDPKRCEIRIYPFFDLVNKSLNPDFGCCPQRTVNLGATVQEWIEGSRTESAKEPEGRDYKDVRRCVFACNTLHTNFVRGNGFVVSNHRLIYKPEGAVGLCCPRYLPLNGRYTALIGNGQRLTIGSIEISDNHFLTRRDPDWAISGPRLISDGSPCDAPRNPRQERKYTLLDEVNFGLETKTSFTAFGIDGRGRLIVVSMFEAFRGLGSGRDLGINFAEIAELLLCRELSVKDAILGGGAADTQQFVRGDCSEFMVAPGRARKPEEGAQLEVLGPRGLGAILGVLLRACPKIEECIIR